MPNRTIHLLSTCLTKKSYTRGNNLKPDTAKSISFPRSKFYSMLLHSISLCLFSFFFLILSRYDLVDTPTSIPFLPMPNQSKSDFNVVWISIYALELLANAPRIPTPTEIPFNPRKICYPSCPKPKI